MQRVRTRVAAVVTTAALVASGAVATEILALTVAASPAAAATKGTDTVTAQPAPGSSLAPHTRYYKLTARPGDSVTQTVHLTNNNKHAIDVRVGALDGFTSDATGATYTTPSQTASRTGRWIVVSTPALTMETAEQRDVDFTVHVPRNAKPGQYLAGVGMWVPLTSSSTTVPGSKDAGFAVTLQGERVIAVEIVVPGPAQATLAVRGVKPVAAPEGLRLLLALANTGNALTKGSGVVTVRDTKLNFPFKIDTFVSHTAINYRVPWTRSIVPGVHEVSVRLTYGGGRVTTWNGTVVIAGALQRQLQKDLEGTQVGAPAPARDWSGLLGLLGLLVAFGCVAAAVWLRRRARGEPVPAG